jgi:adenylosuccinate lyase
VRADPEVRAHLTLTEIEEIFRLDRALRHVDAIFRRVFGDAARPVRADGEGDRSP